jgi:hypothetical protein
MIDIIIDKSGFQKILLQEKLKIYGFLAKLFLKSRINRTYDVVNADYDLGSWNRNIDKIDFYTHYGKTEKNDMVIFTCNGGLFKDTRSRFEKKYNSMLVDILSEYKQESVVELGCGIGVHQFLLYNEGFQKLEGYDLSENAISVNKQYSDKKEIPILFGVHDLNQPFPENMIKNKVIFTHACLEQCHMIMANVLNNILQGKPKIVINFEVDYDSSPLMVKKHFDSRGYQNNLVRELKKLQKEKKIEIISIEKLPLSLSPFNRLSAIIWKIK